MWNIYHGGIGANQLQKVERAVEKLRKELKELWEDKEEI